jgi:proto-oncogene tyrosine-protein kinase ROS
MTQCWAQEPEQRPTFHKIQEQLHLFRNFSLNSISHHRDEASGVINEGFEGKFDSLKFSSFLTSVN